MNTTSSITDLKMLFVEQMIVLWRHKWIALIGCWVACVVGWSAVLMLPRSYQSSARAYVDVDGLLTPLLKGLVVKAPQDDAYLRRTLLSRPNLEQVVHLVGLDAGKTNAEKDAIIADMSSNLKLRSQGKNLFRIAYTDADPQLAKNVVDSLLTIFAEKAAGSSRVDMEKAQTFLDTQIAAYEKQLRDAEQRRADFRKQYADYLGDPSSGQPRIDILQQAMIDARRTYQEAQVTRDSLVNQLKEIPQFRMVDSPTIAADGKIVAASPAVRLSEARAHLGELKQRFTDQHPDVQAAQRRVEDLEAEMAMRDPKTSDEGKKQEANPVYAQIRLKLVEAETAVPAAKERMDAVLQQLEKMKTLTADLPDIDVKAKDLDRDYEIIKKNHDELVQRREAALLSQAADEQADRTQFRIVDPPQVPLLPAFPNLPLMFSLVLLAGAGVAVVLPIAYELLLGTYASASRLRSLGLPVIGAVTFVPRPGAQRRMVLGASGAMMTLVGLLLAYGVLMLISVGAYAASS